MSVLLVEDEPRIARFLIKGLRHHCYEVQHVATGTDALKASASGRHALVLLDLGAARQTDRREDIVYWASRP